MLTSTDKGGAVPQDDGKKVAKRSNFGQRTYFSVHFFSTKKRNFSTRYSVLIFYVKLNRNGPIFFERLMGSSNDHEYPFTFQLNQHLIRKKLLISTKKIECFRWSYIGGTQGDL